MPVLESGQKICVAPDCDQVHGPEVVSCKSQYVSRETIEEAQ
jgi:hypothetical protein